MDAIISFLFGIVIFLFGFIWKYIEKKRHSRYKREIEEKSKLIGKKKGDNKYYDGLKPVLENVKRLEKNNYIHKEEMSDEERKFLEKNDKKIDKKHGKIINDLSKKRAINNDEIEDAEGRIKDIKYWIEHPAKMTEYFGIVIALLSLILQLIQK